MEIYKLIFKSISEFIDLLENGYSCKSINSLKSKNEKNQNLENEDYFVRHYYKSIFIGKIWRNIQKGNSKYYNFL
jgi:hypothetical protein